MSSKALNIFVLAGDSEEGLKAELAGISTTENFATSKVRTEGPYRFAAVYESEELLRGLIQNFLNGERTANAHFGKALGDNPPVCFLFSGQGSQYPLMGHELYETLPVYREAFDVYADSLDGKLEPDLRKVMFDPATSEALLFQTAYTQPALFAMECALAKVWRRWGVKPAAAVGHSLGDFISACEAEVFTPQDGLKMVTERGRLMQELPKNGIYALVYADLGEVVEAIQPYLSTVAVAGVNAPEIIVISGAHDDVLKVLETFEEKGIKVRRLNVSLPFHSPLMEPMLDDFDKVVSTVPHFPPKLQWISNLTGQVMPDDEVPPSNYWRRHIREAVRFWAGMVTLYDEGFKAYLEVGPSTTLIAMAREALVESEGCHWIHSLKRTKSDWQVMLNAAASLYVLGVNVNLGQIREDLQNRISTTTLTEP